MRATHPLFTYTIYSMQHCTHILPIRRRSQFHISSPRNGLPKNNTPMLPRKLFAVFSRFPGSPFVILNIDDQPPLLLHGTPGDCTVKCIVDNKEQAITGRTNRLGEGPETQSGCNKGGQPILRWPPCLFIRNQQVAGSIPAVGSTFSSTFRAF